MNSSDQARTSSRVRAIADPDATDEYNTCQNPVGGDEGRTDIQIDYIDEALEESMPASDPPSWTPTTGVGQPGGHPGKGRS